MKVKEEVLFKELDVSSRQCSVSKIVPFRLDDVERILEIRERVMREETQQEKERESGYE